MLRYAKWCFKNNVFLFKTTISFDLFFKRGFSSIFLLTDDILFLSCYTHHIGIVKSPQIPEKIDILQLVLLFILSCNAMGRGCTLSSSILHLRLIYQLMIVSIVMFINIDYLRDIECNCII